MHNPSSQFFFPEFCSRSILQNFLQEFQMSSIQKLDFRVYLQIPCLETIFRVHFEVHFRNFMANLFSTILTISLFPKFLSRDILQSFVLEFLTAFRVHLLIPFLEFIIRVLSSVSSRNFQNFLSLNLLQNLFRDHNIKQSSFPGSFPSVHWQNTFSELLFRILLFPQFLAIYFFSSLSFF